jgi:hypothetical protein
MEAVACAIDIVPMLLTDGPQKAMNRLHTRASVAPAAGPGSS